MEEVIFCHKGNGRLASRLKESFGVECRAPSRRLQRVMTDFGADEPSVRAAEKIREHYGVEVPASSVRNVTLAHAREFARQEQEALDEQYPRLPEGVDRVILQSDGAMVPVVEIEAGRGDARRRRSVCWKEAKSSLACGPGSLTPVYAATMKDRDHAGWQMRNLAIEAGMGRRTKVHALGDGASWIEEKVRTHFGRRASYLIYFYHLCDYFAEAAERAPIQNKSACLGRLKAAAKKGQMETIPRWFQKWEEPASVPKEEAPIRALMRYVNNRPGQFDYPNAIKNGLPIGSGQIESSHRHLIQKRLKISGAWWKKQNADSMLQLRVARKNQKWKDYWKQLGPA